MAAVEKRGMTVCHECMLLLRRPGKFGQTRLASPAAIRQWTGRSFTTNTPPQPRRELQIQETGLGRSRIAPYIPRRQSTTHPVHNLAVLHTRILELSSTALTPDDGPIPSEQRLLYVLEQLTALAKSLVDAKSVTDAKRQATADSDEKSTTATSALLGSVNTRQNPAHLTKASLLNLISQKAEEILRHPNCFITPGVLKSYVDLQSLLHQPSSFPLIFDLYASKSIPLASRNGTITYKPASPNKPTAAIDSATANAALTSAITSHNLPLCIDIIQSTLCTPAFHRSKTLRQALIPLTGLTLAPAAAYILSTHFSHWQSTMDPTHATQIAFAGIMTYIFTVSGLGYVVVTTANDQMDRITWAKGVPLWERWVREEERAALDRVAGKWGFQERERRGEEEGGEWEGLREFVGRRGMVLDRVELMEGME